MRHADAWWDAYHSVKIFMMSLGLPVVIFAALAVWLGGWWLNWRLSRSDHPAARAAIPVIFGLTLLALWEIVVRGFAVPQVILPGPSAIAAAIAANTGLLWADFWQTVVRSVLPGYAIGCGAGIAVALATDRSPFLQRGLLPIGTLAAALPIVGIAPIMVMWFGFDWQSKAAVAALMCFFPMLVNTIQGLRAADRAEAELLVTYAASYGQALRRLRWPAAMPFVFAGLKVCTTLALIGAIVAEFFGTPTVGIGFRISTGIGRLALDMVWAEIAVAALAGTAFYALVAAAERAVTFWHPSMRG